jgi:DNA-binding PadR family transcriptional regulator
LDYVVPARVALLLELARDPGYGTQLADRLRERTGDKVNLLQGSIYPKLSELTKMGLVESKKADGPGSDRIYYFLTHAGRKLADEYREVLMKLATDR